MVIRRKKWDANQGDKETTNWCDSVVKRFIHRANVKLRVSYQNTSTAHAQYMMLYATHQLLTTYSMEARIDVIKKSTYSIILIPHSTCYLSAFQTHLTHLILEGCQLTAWNRPWSVPAFRESITLIRKHMNTVDRLWLRKRTREIHDHYGSTGTQQISPSFSG